MPWPPILPTGTRSNVTPQANTHPDDHNKIHAALNDIITRFPSSKAWSQVWLPSANVFIDQLIEWPFSDGQVFSVPTVQTITVSASTTGWLTGVVPTMAIYSNDIGDPWNVGAGLTFAFAQGVPIGAANIANVSTARPVTLPSLTVSRKIAAGANGINYRVRVQAHTNPGAIPWWGRHDVSITRTLDLT
jgi:hypothetical protein